MIDTFVELEPLSDKAQELIDYHGSVWVVRKHIHGKPFANATNGEWIFVHPYLDTKVTKKVARWVKLNKEDEHFFVVFENEAQN